MGKKSQFKDFRKPRAPQFKDFREACEQEGLNAQLCSSHHWKVVGPSGAVNFYPTSKRIHIDGNDSKSVDGDMTAAITLAKNLSPQNMDDRDDCPQTEQPVDKPLEDWEEDIQFPEYDDCDQTATDGETVEGVVRVNSTTPSSLEIQHGGKHYKNLAIQPAEYNHKNEIPFCAAEAIKYLTRYRAKNKEEDIRKAIHFCQMIMEFDYDIPVKVLYGQDALDKPASGDEDSE